MTRMGLSFWVAIPGDVTAGRQLPTEESFRGRARRSYVKQARWISNKIIVMEVKQGRSSSSLKPLWSTKPSISRLCGVDSDVDTWSSRNSETAVHTYRRSNKQVRESEFYRKEKGEGRDLLLEIWRDNLCSATHCSKPSVFGSTFSSSLACTSPLFLWRRETHACQRREAFSPPWARVEYTVTGSPIESSKSYRFWGTPPQNIHHLNLKGAQTRALCHHLVE